MFGSHPIQKDQQQSLTRESRNILSKKIGQEKSREAIRYITADQLDSMSNLGNFDALFVAFGNFCPYCRALKKTLADTAESLMKRKKQSSKVHVVLFETSDPKNQEFAEKTLKNKYVPAFFLLRSKNGHIWLEEWENSDKVTSYVNDRGEMEKVLPIDILLKDLSGDEKKNISRENMELFNRTANENHRQRLSQLNLIV